MHVHPHPGLFITVRGDGPQEVLATLDILPVLLTRPFPTSQDPHSLAQYLCQSEASTPISPQYMYTKYDRTSDLPV